MDAAASGQLKTPAIQAIRGLKGNDNFKVDGGSVLDVLTGALLGTTPLTQSQMMTEGTKQRQNIAQADASQDLREGALAWREKRPPVFTGA